MPKKFTDPDDIAEDIIRDVGTNLVVGLPLGLGKANHIANALYARAAADRTINLTFFTALTLEKPRPKSLLERRFIAPVIDRLFGGYPDLAYAGALHADALPPNINVIEFFFLAGKWLHAPFAQQHYISANYTHASSYLLARGLNVVTQLVAKRVVDGETRYSLSCNTDTTLDLLRARAEGRAAFKLYRAGQFRAAVHAGRGRPCGRGIQRGARQSRDRFSAVRPAGRAGQRHQIRHRPACRDPGARRRHAADRHRPDRRRAGAGPDRAPPRQCAISRDHAAAFAWRGAASAQEADTFEKGLYGVSEMLTEAFIGLIEAGILKREVDGVVLHGAFFLGPKSFYRALREMTPDQIARIQMMPVSFTNELYGDEAAKRRARVDARFVNNAMMATLMGAAISDGLEDGQVVSGVGGQYNFVAQAFALQGARSILTLEATRQAGAKAQSNIRWATATQTIPRHLRDVIVTEYGVADLRGKSDADVIAAMLAVADSRFQGELARQAKDAGKLPKNFEIPAAHRENFPERIKAALKPAREAGLLPSFPFGSDFTDTEQRLIPALQVLQEAQRSPLQLPGLLWQGFFAAARCCRRRMPGAARARYAHDVFGARLSRAGECGAGEEQGV